MVGPEADRNNNSAKSAGRFSKFSFGEDLSPADSIFFALRRSSRHKGSVACKSRGRLGAKRRRKMAFPFFANGSSRARAENRRRRERESGNCACAATGTEGNAESCDQSSPANFYPDREQGAVHS